MTDVQYEGIGAAAGGFTQPQYSMLKERIAPYCQAIAKGGSAPADARLVYTDDEIQAMKPRCSALLVAIKKTT
jgi:coproporphyrinogen III oxidase-like Fe-S oxidoreductase